MKTLKIVVFVFTLVVSAGVNATTVGLTSNFWYTPTLANNLTSQGYTVTVVDSYTEASLAGFDAFIMDGNGFFDNAALDTFVFNGGTLIELPWSLGSNYDYSGQLRLISDPTSGTYGSPNPSISVLDAGSYLLNGVTLPSAGDYTIGYEIGAQFTGTGNSVLLWDDGSALLAENTYGAGRVIAFNLHLITSDSNPLNASWSNQIVFNALGAAAVPEPETYAMFMAGLGLMGFVARRRKV